ncbi:hypothetical protein [Sphingomonas sp. C3-2]|uniref:hypothetical protein n=1 Tax=Sphingomonas sp. C3-2 TaxID=3062169 RepID=UPI00294B30FA|nr:hypothetical protein [Sphingomonas sp. C3-2]WOK36574.1 hypothetical protein QYC26_16505 [Sphingomonas sp. C3-2]
MEIGADRQPLHIALERQLRRWRNLPSRLALRASNHPYVRVLLRRRHDVALARHRGQLPALDALSAEIVSAIEERGLYVTTLDQLGLSASDAMLASSTKLAEEFAEEARLRVRFGEDFLIVPSHRIIANPEIFLWGLQDRLLNIAEAYLGLPPAYDGVTVNYTVADGREISTRKWHRDWEDRRMLKIAIYLHDVDENAGPFQMIPRKDAHSGDIDGFSYELADDLELARHLGPDFTADIASCEGPRGTVIFTDTARFYHRGKPATGRDRAAIFYSYFANRPRHPFLCERTGMSRRAMYRMAKDLPQRQRNAVRWRKQISPLLRMIPTALL